MALCAFGILISFLTNMLKGYPLLRHRPEDGNVNYTDWVIATTRREMVTEREGR